MIQQTKDHLHNHGKLFVGLILFCLILTTLLVMALKPDVLHAGFSFFHHPENVGAILK